MPSHYGHSKQRQGKAKAKAAPKRAAAKRSNLGGRIASGIHEVSPKRTRGKVYKPLGYGEGFGGAGAKSQHHPWLGMPRATPDIDRQRQRKDELRRRLRPEMIPDWGRRRNLPNPGPDSPLGQQSGRHEPGPPRQIPVDPRMPPSIPPHLLDRKKNGKKNGKKK